jgi:hypothetical protein
MTAKTLKAVSRCLAKHMAKRYYKKEAAQLTFTAKQSKYHTMQCYLCNFGFQVDAIASLQKKL